MAKAKSITIERLTELMKEGIEYTDKAERRDMVIHATDKQEQARAKDYRRGFRHGMDALLGAAEKAAK